MKNLPIICHMPNVRFLNQESHREVFQSVESGKESALENLAKEVKEELDGLKKSMDTQTVMAIQANLNKAENKGNQLTGVEFTNMSAKKETPLPTSDVPNINEKIEGDTF